MKIISKSSIKKTAGRGMFITATPRNRGLSMSADLIRALGFKGKSEGFLTLAQNERGYLAMKAGEESADSFRVHRYGWTMRILGTAPITPPSPDGKPRRFLVEKVGEWFISEMRVNV